MSGPKTTNYEINRALSRLERTLDRQLEEERRNHIVQQQRAAEAERKRLEQLRQANAKAREAKSAFEEYTNNLQDLIARNRDVAGEINTPTLPAYPNSSDQSALVKYANEVIRLGQSIQDQFKQLSANLNFRHTFSSINSEDYAPPKTAAELIKSFTQASKLTTQPNQLATRKAEAEKLTQRIENLGIADIDAQLRAQLREFMSTDSELRADILGTEIRLKTQQLLQELENIQQERLKAEDLLEKLLGSEATFEGVKLREQLILVAAGSTRMTSDLKKHALIAIEDLENQRLLNAQKQDQADAADILEHVFRDLGYEVEPITHTLFGEGGMIHFRQPGWDKDYYVRMRVEPERKIANFNMVRTAGASGDDQIWKSQDTKMENAWCGDQSTGFRQLLKVATDRGLSLELSRHIEAGKLAVQVVPQEAVPLVELEKKAITDKSAQSEQLLHQQVLR